MIRQTILATLTALLLAPPALAHEFTVTFILPPPQQQSARQAFLLASSERDSHPGETSEGHLGGLDSQLELAAPDAPIPASDIIVAIAPARLPPGTGAAWAFTVADIGPRARAEFLDDGDFTARYTARYAAPPDKTATRGYVAARLIDRAVRALGGADDRAALQRAVADY